MPGRRPRTAERFRRLRGKARGSGAREDRLGRLYPATIRMSLIRFRKPDQCGNISSQWHALRLANHATRPVERHTIAVNQRWSVARIDALLLLALLSAMDHAGDAACGSDARANELDPSIIASS